MLRSKMILALAVAAVALGAGTPAYAQFGGLQNLDPFNRNSALNRAGVRPGDLLPRRPAPSLSRLPVEPFRTGPVIVTNNYDRAVAINLYHPAAPGRIDRSYLLLPGQRAFLGDSNMIVGEDWGIQLDFRNGNRSAVSPVGRLSNYGGGTFVTLASRIYAGG